MTDEIDAEMPDRIYAWPFHGWNIKDNPDGTKSRTDFIAGHWSKHQNINPSMPGTVEYVRADLGSFYQEKDIDALMAERDALRQRAEKAEEEIKRLEGLHASGCFVEYDNGDRVCVWGWAGGAATGGALSALSVSYEAADGSRWSRTYKAADEWEDATND
jgi:hypothetical protein